MAVQLWKTTIVIWSDFDPQEFSPEDLGREAMEGSAYCTEQRAEFVSDLAADPDGAELVGDEEGFLSFFGMTEDES